MLIWLLMLLLAFAACMAGLASTSAYFSDTETGSVRISVGEWGEPLKICCVCPCWGISGACKWAVFIHGEGFTGDAAVKLVKGDEVIEASKSCVVSDNKIFAVFDLRGAAGGYYDVRVELDNGNTGELENGFLVISWIYCMRGHFNDYPGGEDRLAIEKEYRAENPRDLRVTLRGDLSRPIYHTYLVSAGYLLEGRVIDKKKSEIVLAFNLEGAPPAGLDLLLTTSAGWMLFFEEAVKTGEITHPVKVFSIDPGAAFQGKVSEFILTGDSLPENAQVRLRKNDVFISSSGIRRESHRRLICTFDFTGALPGVYDLVIEAPGRVMTILPGCFTVHDEQTETLPETEPLKEETTETPEEPREEPEKEQHMEEPVEFSLEPDSGRSGEIADIAIIGGPFYPGMRARLRGDEKTTLAFICELRSVSRMECRINLYNLPVGIYKLEIVDDIGKIIYTVGDFEVL